MTDVTINPDSKICGGNPNIEIRDKRTTINRIQILNVIFIYLFSTYHLIIEAFVIHVLRRSKPRPISRIVKIWFRTDSKE